MENSTFVVSPVEAGARLDVFLTRHLKDESRASIQRLIEDGVITVNGQESKPAYRLRFNDRIELHQNKKATTPDVLMPWAYPISILYEDEELLAINKPSRIITHPGAGKNQHTLANAIVTLRPEIRNIGHPMRPGIVHRLDQETSGLLLLAKTEKSYLALSRMFKDRQIEKHYRALAYGKFANKNGRIDRALGRDPKDRKKISVRAKHSRSALTMYTVLEQFDFGAILDVQILTGRTHQIRVHLSSEAHPIVGDAKYGGGNWNRIKDATVRNTLKKSGFFGLHSLSLDFKHPTTAVDIHLEAPLPSNWMPVQNL